MNAVEIEEAVSELVLQPFDAAEFPFRFLAAFSARETTLKRLRKGDSNQSDVGGVLWRGNIHLAVAPTGEAGTCLAALRASPRTASAKAKFILATDGETVEAEDLVGGDVVACAFADLPRHFATFLPLAGISTVKEIKNNPIDVKATGRLNKLYVELLKDNPDWATEERRHELNQFMARLIFCFFAEDTGIFRDNQFTATITQMSHAGHGSGPEQWGNTHEVLTELFRAMDTPVTHAGNLDGRHRRAAGIRPYADVFPYVNGGLFTGATKSPRFSRTSRVYLLRAGELDWKEINPDIFGSMIQAVADDGERGELGMHYTSVPNILKVLNPLFLDDLRAALEAAGDSRQRLRNLRKRLANIRVFDPACGSGNFLVIAYKEMRTIEAAIVERLGGEASLKLDERRSVIPLSNFYGIEIKGFAAEIARLALLIAEFQADCLYLSQQEARAMVLPLHKTGQITVGNALRLDWLEVCPPVRAATTAAEHDLGGPTGRLALEVNGLEDDGEAETYICGNPPYLGGKKQSDEQKSDMIGVFGTSGPYKNLDYICAFFLQAARRIAGGGQAAFVSTSSLNQGTHIPTFWPILARTGVEIGFGYDPFRWTNSAANNAGVYVTIVGIRSRKSAPKYLFSSDLKKSVTNINAYLIEGGDLIVEPFSTPLSALSPMITGNAAYDGGSLFFEPADRDAIVARYPESERWFARVSGTSEFTEGKVRWCLWLDDSQLERALEIAEIAERVAEVLKYRKSGGEVASTLTKRPHQFRYRHRAEASEILVPQVSAENREYLPLGLLGSDTVLTHLAHAIYDPEPHDFALLSSRLHYVWTRTLGGRLGNGVRYSSNICWNTFPVPRLTVQDKADLTRTAENILLAREAHFPATIADLYDPDAMPDDLRRAHEENDEVLERIYIGRRFRNDTERLEKLFDLYTKMAANAPKPTRGKKAA